MSSELTNVIEFNGERKAVSDETNVSQLIAQQNITGKRFLVVVNDSLVPKSEWDSTLVVAGDKVDIMTAITGG